MKTLDEKLLIADKRVAELEAKLAATNKDLEYYRRVARELTAGFGELGITVWSKSDVAVVASTEIKAAKDHIEKGKHMTIFHNAIRDNPVVADAWKRFMMALRLVGLDGTNKPEEN